MLLYELIVGTTPFDAEQLRSRGYDEICRVIRESEPPTPSRRLSALGEAITEVCQHRQAQPATLRKLVHGDLDWIVMKCLEKDRSQRYETVDSLARDIERHLNNEPIEARAPSLVYRLRKSIRKHRVPVAAVSAVLVAICVGLVVATVGFLSAVEQRDLANAHADRADLLAKQSQLSLYASDIDSAYQAWELGNLDRVRELLTRHRPEAPEQDDLRGFEWRYLWSQYQSILLTPTFPHEAPVHVVAFSPDSSLIASGGYDHKIKLWNAIDGTLKSNLVGHKDHILALVFMGDTLVSGCGDGNVTLWNVTTDSQEQSFDVGVGIRSLALSLDGKTLAVGTFKGPIQLWNTENWQQTGQLVDERSLSSVKTIAFAPDGSTLASGNAKDQTVKIWDLHTKEISVIFPAHEYLVNSVAYAPDGKTLASGGVGDSVNLWNVDDTSRPKQVMQTTGRKTLVWSLVFTPDGESLVGAGMDRTVKVWDVNTGLLRKTLRGHADMVMSVAISADGRRLISGSIDETAKMWELGKLSRATNHFPHYGIEETSLAFSHDGKTLALASGDHDKKTESSIGQVTLWDVDSGQPPRVLLELAAPATSVAFSPDSKTLAVGVDRLNASGKRTGEIRLVNVVSGAVERTLKGHTNLISSVAFSPDGVTLVSASHDGSLRLWAVSNGKELKTIMSGDDGVYCADFSPDGKTIACGQGSIFRFNGQVKLWDVATGKEFDGISGFRAPVYSVTFSPNGEFLASASGDARLGILNTRTRKKHFLRGHANRARSVAYSPDGKTLASCGRDGTVKLWHVATGQELATFNGRLRTTVIRFSPDGRTLAAACQDNTITLWRTQTDKTQSTVMGYVVLRAPTPSRQSEERRGRVTP